MLCNELYVYFFKKENNSDSLTNYTHITDEAYIVIYQGIYVFSYLFLIGVNIFIM